MKKSLPRTPFSTPFSSSKKLLETRIRGILAGPQKRPPLPLLALVLAFCFFSVNLVSCQPAQTENNPDGSAASVQDPIQDPILDEEAARRMAERFPDYDLDPSQIQVSFSTAQGDKRLILFHIPSTSHAGGFDDLIAGVWDDATEAVSGDAWLSRGDDGLWSTWTEGDALYLLLSNYSVYSGEEIGEPPVWLRFENGVLEHPPCILPGATREVLPDLPDDAVFFDPMNPGDYWYDHKAVPVEGGLEFYTVHENWRPMESTPRAKWSFAGLIPLSDTAPFPAKAATADEAIDAVFMGKSGFYYEAEFFGETGTFLTIRDIPSILDPDDAYPVLDFAAADLDGDGEDENILRPHGGESNWDHFLILDWEDGTVCGELVTEEELPATLDLEWHELGDCENQRR